METLTELDPADLSPEPNDEELVPTTDPRSPFLSINKARLGGVPCFVGTRVPIQILWEYLENGTDLAEFLDDYEGVPRDEAVEALKFALQRLLSDLPGRPWR